MVSCGITYLMPIDSSYPTMWIGITRTDGSAKHSRSNELTKGCEYYAEPVRISTVCRSGYVIMHHTAFRRADQPKRARQSHLGDGGLLLQFYRAKRRCSHAPSRSAYGKQSRRAREEKPQRPSQHFGRRSPRAPRVHILCLSLYV